MHLLRAVSLQYVLPHLTRLQPKNRQICLQHCSSAHGRRHFHTAGYSYRETKPKKGMLRTVCSNMTQNLMHFMDQHQGGLCTSLSAFPLPGMLGRQCVLFPGGGWHHSHMLCGHYFTGRRKGRRQLAEIPSDLPSGSCLGPVTLQTSKEGYQGHSECSTKIIKKGSF